LSLENVVGGTGFGEWYKPPFVSEVMHVYCHHGDDTNQCLGWDTKHDVNGIRYYKASHLNDSYTIHVVQFSHEKFYFLNLSLTIEMKHYKFSFGSNLENWKIHECKSTNSY